jgi:glycerol-3-phosphate dehydrogenase
VAGAYAGVRPLISADVDSKKSVDISRRAELYETSSGMITITGGKLTTWRRMAKLVVDRLVEREFREAPCRTHEIPLGHPAQVEQLPEIDGLDSSSRDHLAARYGLFAEQVLKICERDRKLAQPIVPGMPDVLAETVVAARHEQARSVADVLLRRTRLGLLAARKLTTDSRLARPVAAALGSELGWGRRRIGQEVDAWLEAAEAEGLVTREADPAARAVAG